MNRDRSPTAASADIVRSILTRDAGAGSQAITADELQRACTRVCDNLRESLGEDGATALLARSLARTAGAHPALKTIQHENGRGITLDGVVASVEQHGIDSSTAAIEALFVALVDVLGRLIGEDMAGRLLDHNGSRAQRGKGARAP